MGSTFRFHQLIACSYVEPALLVTHPIARVAYPYNVKLAGEKALCSLGPYGLQVVDVSQ